MSHIYKAAVIGCGKISQMHAKAFLSSPSVSLVAAADMRAEAREGFRLKYGVEEIFDDAARMMELTRPEIVSICTWAGSHAELTETACAGGARAIICEKPMAVDLSDADRMIAAARKAGAVLLVNHQRRFANLYTEGKGLLEGGVIGRVTNIHGSSAGDALSHGTHVIDTIRLLCHDTPIWGVLGAIDMSPRMLVDPWFVENGKHYGHHIETSSLSRLIFEDETPADLEFGEIASSAYIRIAIDGTDGRMEFTELSGIEGHPTTMLRYQSGRGDWVLPSLRQDDPFAESLRRLLTIFETGGDHPLEAESGRADLEAVTAIYESARHHRLVRLPLSCPTSPLEAMVAAGEVPLNRPEAWDRFDQLVKLDPTSREVDNVAGLLLERSLPMPGSHFSLNRIYARDWWRVYGGQLVPAQLACLRKLATLWEERTGRPPSDREGWAWWQEPSPVVAA